MPAPIPDPIEMDPGAPRLTVAEYIESWLEEYVRRRLTPMTHIGYAGVMRRWWLPGVGHLQLTELTADDLQVVVDQMEEAGLASSTIHVAVQHMRTALERAVSNRILDRNVARAIRRPRRAARSIKSLTQHQAQRFMHFALEPTGTGGKWWYGPMLATALMTGMRAGELRGLQWGDIDLDDYPEDGEEVCGMIHVSQQIATSDMGVVFRPPKTSSGARDIPVTQELAQLLQAHRRRVTRHAAIQGTRRWTENGLVFPNTKGGPAVQQIALRTCKELARLADVEPAPNLVTLRHTFASVMVDAGVPPQVVAGLMGHADVRLTINVYYSATPLAQRDAVAALRRAMGSSGQMLER